MRIPLEPGDPARIAAFTQGIRRDYGKGILLNYEVATKMVASRTWNVFRRDDSFADLAVVRFYRWTRYADLPPDMLQIADDPAIPYWMMLTGTCGMIYDWTRRYQSGHLRLLKPGSSWGTLPLAAFTTLGMETGSPLPVSLRDQVWQEAGGACRLYIPRAADHPAIAGQEDFIRDYQVLNVFGYGNRFPTGSAYIMLAYTRVPVSREAVDRFCEAMEPFITPYLTPYEQRPVLWSELL
jgi:hypothetical protein